MANFYWLNLFLLAFSLGVGVILVTIFFFAIRLGKDPENLPFLLFGWFLLINTGVVFIQVVSAELNPWNISVRPEITAPLFWISNTLLGIAYLWFSAISLDVKPGTLRLPRLAIWATLLAALVVYPANASSSLTILFPLSAIMAKLVVFVIYLRADRVPYKFFLALPVILLFGLDIPAYLSLPNIIIASTLAFSIFGSLHTTIWHGLLRPLLVRTEALQIEIQKSQVARKEIETLNQELIEAYNTTLEGWARALELRDKETEGHSRRVSDLSSKLAAAMQLSEDDQMHMRFGSLLHDIGKMAIQDEILLKPGALTTEERAIIEKHPEYARNLLIGIKFLEKAIVIPTYHHERWDGTGYPSGLAAEEIPLLARMFAVVDVWDALTSNRPYSQAWSPAEAKAYIEKEAGAHFDPNIVKVFFENVIGD